MKYIIHFFIFITTLTSISASNIDSLFILLQKEKEDSSLIILYNKIAKSYEKNNPSQAILYADSAANLARKNKRTREEANAYMHAGIANKYLGEYGKALALFQKSAKLYRIINDKKNSPGASVNIGTIFWITGNFKKAKSFFIEAKAIFEETNNSYGLANCLINLGILNAIEKNYTASEEYFIKSAKLFLKIKDQYGVARNYNNISQLKIETKDYKGAKEYALKALDIRQKINDKYGICSSFILLGNIFVHSNKLDKANSFFKKSLSVATKKHYNDIIKDAALAISKTKNKQKQFKEALKYYKIYTNTKDTMFNDAKSKEIGKLEASYEYEKQKSIDDAKNEKLIMIEKQKKEKQKVITYSVAGGLLLVVIFLVFVFNRLQVTKKQKLIIVKQKEIVEEKQREILDSITYAKRIQSAILPPEKEVKKYLQNSFILYKPKDIVAGDFYWMETVSNNTSLRGTKQSVKKNKIASLHKSFVRNDVVLFAAADCTGHGVPGAMVSVVCNNGLNRSVREHGLIEPGKILDKTREIVIQEFEKSDEEVKDGMDIALCSLEDNTLRYAGANNPLWIIRGNEIIETKANKQPIGKIDNPLPFSTHTFELQKGDTIYIFSDGFVDQFGGEKGKKFKARAFRELLLSIQDKSMEEQKTIIDNTFESWKGNLEQIDDVCIIGVKI